MIFLIEITVDLKVMFTVDMCTSNSFSKKWVLLGNVAQLCICDLP